VRELIANGPQCQASGPPRRTDPRAPCDRAGRPRQRPARLRSALSAPGCDQRNFASRSTSQNSEALH